MLVVDRADEADLRTVVRLAREALSERFPAAWLDAHLDEDHVLVARDLPSDCVVGFAVTQREDACEGHLLALAVDRFHRRRGVGTALLRGVQDRLVRGGAYRLHLEVREDDPEARSFYVRHGFEAEGIQAHAFSDGANAIRLSRPI